MMTPAIAVQRTIAVLDDPFNLMLRTVANEIKINTGLKVSTFRDKDRYVLSVESQYQNDGDINKKAEVLTRIVNDAIESHEKITQDFLDKYQDIPSNKIREILNVAEDYYNAGQYFKSAVVIRYMNQYNNITPEQAEDLKELNVKLLHKYNQ